MSACESSGRNILASEEDFVCFHKFLKDIEANIQADVAQQDNSVLTLKHHLDMLEIPSLQAIPAFSKSSYGIANIAS